LSIPTRTSEGWLFWAQWDAAQLINTNNNNAYNFKLDEGLYKLTDNVSKGCFPPNMGYKVSEEGHVHSAYMNKEKCNKKSFLTSNMWVLMLTISMILSITQGGNLTDMASTASTMPLIKLITTLCGRDNTKKVRFFK